MPTSLDAALPSSDALLGLFERRASKTVSNARLYDLVQDMARALDQTTARFETVESKQDEILRILGQIANRLEVKA